MRRRALVRGLVWLGVGGGAAFFRYAQARNLCCVYFTYKAGRTYGTVELDHNASWILPGHFSIDADSDILYMPWPSSSIKPCAVVPPIATNPSSHKLESRDRRARPKYSFVLNAWKRIWIAPVVRARRIARRAECGKNESLVWRA